ncbi:hypothetical protein [Neorhizobium sp. SHOUNA12A]|nr:hypothetical protein [Neorhizobium sp. SHOUNA12A]
MMYETTFVRVFVGMHIDLSADLPMVTNSGYFPALSMVEAQLA